MNGEIQFPDADAGFTCPHCGSFCKRYRRKLNCNMALVLIELYRNGKRDYVHIEQFMQSLGHKRSGDFAYLVHWKFLEKKPGNREDGSSRNGFYKLTGMGMMFVEGKLSAREKIMIYNNKFEGFDGEEITIRKALTEKFDYNELMGVAV